MWILLGVAVVVGIFVLLIFSRSGPQEMDEDVMREAAKAPPEELERALHPPPKTKEEIEEENELYAEK